jgi:hypothetical protein
VVRRWHQLPLDHALRCGPRVRLLLEQLAGRAVPDLGPAVVMDQLTVLVYDSCEAGAADGLDGRLANLRREGLS